MDVRSAPFAADARRVLSRWGFGWYLNTHQFARALALLPQEQWDQRPAARWAAYRLGLHQTVAQGAPWTGDDAREGLAWIVSQAAVGRGDRAADGVERWQRRIAPHPHWVTLADALAPFLPALALQLLDSPSLVAAGVPRSAVLRLAVAVRAGDLQSAERVVHGARAAGAGAEWPLVQQLWASACGHTVEPKVQLANLNHLLARRGGLSPIRLKSIDQPATTGNLCTRHRLPSVEGPLVSVLMTTHQSHDRVAAALESLLAQTWRNLEIVVVDDASTDGTADVVAALAERDARIRLHRLPGNVGTYMAKTVGWHRARGEFIVCHDSDDWSHPERIAQQMQPLLDSPWRVASTSRWMRIDDAGLPYARPVHPLVRLNPSSPLVRRRAVERRIGLWDIARVGADSEFHSRLRLVFGRHAVVALPRVLSFGAHRAGSLMTDSSTGYNVQGVSLHRLAYWESWGHWHIRELRAGRDPFMPGALAPRPYSTPAQMEVPGDARAAAWQSLEAYA